MTFGSVFAIRDHIIEAQKEFDGFVITTGTDSADEVAFLLDRYLHFSSFILFSFSLFTFNLFMFSSCHYSSSDILWSY